MIDGYKVLDAEEKIVEGDLVYISGFDSVMFRKGSPWIGFKVGQYTHRGTVIRKMTKEERKLSKKEKAKTTEEKLKQAVQLLDAAYDIVELYTPKGQYNIEWKQNWMKRAKELGANPSW